MATDLIRLSNCTVDVRQQRIVRGDTHTPFAGRELALLVYLAERPGQVVSRDELYTEVWGYADGVVSRAVDAALRRLRRKVERDPSAPEHLLSAHGEGYRFEPLREPDPVVDGFVGRGALLGDLRGRLAAGAPITLVGAGGVGKTRLASELARLWPGPVVRCWLGTLRDGEDRASADAFVARQVGVPARAEDPVAAVTAALRGRPDTLLVLDNLEQLSGFASRLEAWGAVVPVVATSRVPTGAPSELVVDVEPLERDDAIALFQRLSGGPADDGVGDIVDAVDRLPLAIELAAARTSVLSVAAIAKRLAGPEGRDRVLRRPTRRGDGHDALRETIAWSWALLEPADRVALAQASVFRTGCTVEAAEAVLRLPDDADPLDALHRLRSHGLVRSEVEEDGRLSLHLLVAVRDFAVEHLEPGDARELQDRHARWFAGQLPDPERIGLGDVAALDELDRMLPELLAGIDGAADGRTAAALALGCAEVLRVRGPVAQGLQALERAAARQDVPSSEHVALTIARGRLLWTLARADEAVPLLEPLAEDHLLAAVWFGSTLNSTGQHGRARQVLLDALSRARAQGRVGIEIDALLGLGQTQARGSADAIGALEEGWTLARRVGARGRQGLAAASLGLHLALVDPAAAERWIRQAIEAYTAVGDTLAVAHARANLGNQLRLLRRPDEAIEELRAALVDIGGAGMPELTVGALRLLATTEAERGNLDQARRHLEEALRVDRLDGGGRERCPLLEALAVVERMRGDLAAARTLLRAASQELEGSGDERRRSEVRANLAEAELLAGDVETARALVQEALSGPLEPYFEAWAWTVAAEAAAAAGDLDGVSVALDRARGLDPRLPDVPVVALVRARLDVLSAWRDGRPPRPDLSALSPADRSDVAGLEAQLRSRTP